MAHAQLAGALVHARRERAFRTCNAFGKGDGRVVAGGDEETAQQVVDGGLRACLRKHAGAARFGVTLPRGPWRDRHSIRQPEPASAISRKTISAVRIFVADSGATDLSAF